MSQHDDTRKPTCPFMTTREAAEYCRVSPATIRYAVQEGKLQSSGRRGGTGPFMFDTADLDVYMRGSAPWATIENPAAPKPRQLTAKEEMAAVVERLRAVTQLSPSPRPARRSTVSR